MKKKTIKSKKIKLPTNAESIIKTEKISPTISVNKYVEGDMEFVETAKAIDPDTEFVTTPWGTKVKADEVVTVLEEFYSLSPKERESEKQPWVDLISKMMGAREDGLKVVDIELASDGSRNIRFVYR